MDEIHIGIYVSGGVVQSTVANQKVTIHIIDEDNIESDGGDAEEIWCKAKSDYNMCPSKSVSDYHSFSEVDFCLGKANAKPIFMSTGRRLNITCVMLSLRSCVTSTTIMVGDACAAERITHCS